VCECTIKGDLHFAYARLSDQLSDDRVYKCVVFNPHLDLRAGGSYTRVSVQPAGMFSFHRGFVLDDRQVEINGSGPKAAVYLYLGSCQTNVEWNDIRFNCVEASLTA